MSSKKGSGGSVGAGGIIVGLGCVACKGAQQRDDAVELASIPQTKASGSACASIEIYGFVANFSARQQGGGCGG